MSPTPDFAAHRARLLAQLGPHEALLVTGAPTTTRNGDADYLYRPDSDVWWLSGWPDPEVAIFLKPGVDPFTLFVQPRDPEREQWTGRRAGPEGARTRFGADHAFEFSDLEGELVRLLQGVDTLHYDFGRHGALDAMIQRCITRAARAARRNGLDVPETFVSLSRTLHELRLFKTPDEIAVLREASAITAQAHLRCMAAGRAGTGEAQLDALLLETFRRHGGNGPGYANIVAAGDNATILHYIENRATIAPNDLVLIDAGCEFACYTADVTRTFPASGRFEGAGRALYEVVLDAQLKAIEACKPGAHFLDVHDVAVQALTEGMIALGLLQGDPEELITSEAYKRYYMHGTSHWLGLDVHDVGAYARAGEGRVLSEGIVLTVEPGLYVRAEDTLAPEAFRGIGIRIEDDVLITAQGHDVLTAEIPKRIDDVQAACRS